MAEAGGSERVAGTHTIERLAAIWRELLGAASVGPDDDFFDLGGHSIFVLRLLDRVAGEFAVAVTVEDLHKFRTVATLAQRVDELRGSDTRPSTVDSAELPGDG
jgi:acyl carrier protein